jgi:uncharacterized protein (TIGR02145 family)
MGFNFNQLTHNKMKKIIACSFIVVFLSNTVFSQVGIGTTSPNANAILELSSTSQGMKFPRLTTLQRTSIALPAKGLTVFDTEINCLMTNFGTSSVPSWKCLGGLAYTVPGAPTSPIATAIYKQATVSFTAPASNGGTDITGYTVTSSPGGFSATGASSPLVVTGLTNGTAYTFTVVATNAVGNSSASSVSSAVIPNCGAYVSAGVYKVFSCFNLGATDTTVDPNIPIQGIHGNYYQWGRNTVVATTSTAAGAISGWNTTAAANGAWLDASKTANDPCPTGFRVPTYAQWSGVSNTALNTITRTGSWSNSETNFTTAISFGTSTVKTLTLPAAGFRSYYDGTLTNRGANGGYWSSTENDSFAWYLGFNSSSANTSNSNRASGFSVRCVSE